MFQCFLLPIAGFVANCHSGVTTKCKVQLQGCNCKLAWYIKEDCHLKALFFFIIYFLKSSYKTTKNGKIFCLSNLIQSTSNLPFPFSNPLFDLLFLIFTINN